MNYKRIICLFLCVLSSSVIIFGCKEKNSEINNSSSGTIKLTLWGSADDQKMLASMVDAFKEQNSSKKYDITLKVMGEDNALTEVMKDPSAAADVYAIAHDQLGTLVESDAIYENTLYSEEIKKNSTPEAINASTYNGKIYGYPASQKTYFLYYDKKIFSDDDVKSLDTMLAKDIPSDIDRFGMDIGNAYYSASFFFTNGCKLFGDDGKDESIITFNDANGVAAAKYISMLKSRGVVSINDESSDTRFSARKLGAYISGDWKAESFKEKLGNDYGVAPLPNVDMGNGNKRLKSFAGFNIYCVNAKTSFPKDAMALANFLTNKENQLKRFKERNLMPVNKELTEDNSLRVDVTVSAILDQLKYSIPMPSIKRISKFWQPTGALTKDLFDGIIKEDNLKTKLDQLISDIKS